LALEHAHVLHAHAPVVIRFVPPSKPQLRPVN
jgi:hypothetical protein